MTSTAARGDLDREPMSFCGNAGFLPRFDARLRSLRLPGVESSASCWPDDWLKPAMRLVTVDLRLVGHAREVSSRLSSASSIAWDMAYALMDAVVALVFRLALERVRSLQGVFDGGQRH